MNAAGAVDYVKRHWFYYLALLLVVAAAVQYRTGAISSFVIPTWGNTMYHVGIERATLETGHYPTEELSYGGGFKNFYVPAYRLLVVALSAATGIDPMPMSGMVVLLLGAFCLLALYAVAYRVSGGNYWVALFAAFFFLLSPDLTINTERPFPELMGLFILPVALYFVLREDWPLATLMAIAMVVTHQQSVLALVGILGVYSIFQLVAAFYYKRSYRKFLLSLAPIVGACGMYALWQMYSMGTLNITNISQLTYHEQWPVTLSTILETGTFVLLFLVLGLVYVFGVPLIDRLRAKPEAGKAKKARGEPEKSYRIAVSLDAQLLLLAWILGSLILTKNEWIHVLSFSVNTLQSRFYTYFVEVAVILAGFGMYALLSAINFTPMLERPGPASDAGPAQPAAGAPDRRA